MVLKGRAGRTHKRRIFPAFEGAGCLHEALEKKVRFVALDVDGEFEVG